MNKWTFSSATDQDTFEKTMFRENSASVLLDRTITHGSQKAGSFVLRPFALEHLAPPSMSAVRTANSQERNAPAQ